jgi:coatomer subunit beta'
VAFHSKLAKFLEAND